MTQNLPHKVRCIRSTLRADGLLELALPETDVVQPGPGEVLVAVEAAPINPSDLMTLLGPADAAGARSAGTPELPATTIAVPAAVAASHAGRFGLPLSVGIEGAGTVIAAGPGADDLIGKRVAALSLSAGMFAEFKTLKLEECAVLPDGVTTREGAAVFCNPLTALAIVETARLEGHKAMIQTASASNLGQMLVGICREDGFPLVSIVRREAQAELLRRLGATHVVDSSAPTFRTDLRKAVAETGATIAFDAIAGGGMAGELLQAMEDVARSRMPAYSTYGSAEPKQVYLYGHLDPSPLVLDHLSYGMFWDVKLWALPATMARVGPERANAMRQRAIDGIRSTFASSFAHEISLEEMLDPEILRSYARLATGEKYLLVPGR